MLQRVAPREQRPQQGRLPYVGLARHEHVEPRGHSRFQEVAQWAVHSPETLDVAHVEVQEPVATQYESRAVDDRHDRREASPVGQAEVEAGMRRVEAPFGAAPASSQGTDLGFELLVARATGTALR